MEDGKEDRATSSPPIHLRYAVLWHQGIDEPHYDLMFETAPGSALATWRSPVWPINSSVQLQKLRDHRPAFLNFQGTLSGDRGTVTQIETGTCQIEIDGQSRWTIRFDSMSAALLLYPVQDDCWQSQSVVGSK
jgi:hypothetical protein